MKKLFIVVLIVALGAAAYFTRPQDPKKNFAHYLAKKMTAEDANPIAIEANKAIARHYAEGCTYVDRYFWVDVRKRDRTIYTGAFNHWINRAEVKEEMQHDMDAARDKTRDGLHQLEGLTDKAQDRAHDEVTHFNDGK